MVEIIVMTVMVLIAHEVYQLEQHGDRVGSVASSMPTSLKEGAAETASCLMKYGDLF